jgi:hypothetical protein
MLKILIAFVFAASFLLGLESYRSAQLQARRTAEQSELLQGLSALDDPEVLQLVADWRLAYPEPDEDRLQELRDLAQQLRTDPNALRAEGAESAESARSSPPTPAGAGPTVDLSSEAIKAGA